MNDVSDAHSPTTQLGRMESLTTVAARSASSLREWAHEADRSGHLSDESVDILGAAGFFLLQQPGRFGGPEADARTSFEVYRNLAHGCGSSAWVAMILSGSAYTAALFEDRAREDIWGTDRCALVCSNFTLGGTVHPTLGGGTVSGRWQPVSGVRHSQWIIAAVQGAEKDPRRRPVSLALIPMTDMAVERTWETVGMRATGSDTVVANDVFVPQHRFVTIDRLLLGKGAPATGGSVYGATWLSLLAVTTLAPLIGMAESVAVEVRTLVVENHAPTTSGRLLSQAHSLLAAALSLMDTARLHADRALRDVEAGALAGRQLSLQDRARVRMDIGRATQAAREAVGILLTAAGNRSFSSQSRIQRAWRDVEFVSRHVLLSPERNHDVYTRVLFGDEPANSMV
ncbi:acyl-CoA dehydrogenase family protein [Streptomyces sp. NBC_01497]|uniref:acyl-CoA dehydrogenase family protein n=1 Tax=Streptomyces sp. NBC_01497 TaxID=2903885 RepID=UPI002E30DA90|nr:acyl-CoA dehydrogenase family protein [Streptomyces sp. NBC_01497]